MWLSKAIHKTSPQEGIATAVLQDQQLVGEYAYPTIPACSPYGVYSKPPKGARVAVLRTQQGEYSAGAIALVPEELQRGELLLQNAFGARIYLKKDGSVTINGMTITKEGQIAPAVQEG